MTLHKLTAGNGYTYLTRQVAAQDVGTGPAESLGGYYSEKGEAPGVWMGRGLAGVSEFPIGAQVTEAQMIALFGAGRHPNAQAIERAAQATGADPQQVEWASRLGAPYRVYEQSSEFRRRCAAAFREHNLARGAGTKAAVPADDRARIRTAVAREMFGESYGRPPADARELSGHLARISRQATTAVAGYDLTFSPVKSVSTLWAIAPRAVADAIERAHADAVTDTLTWLEDHATYTRIGRNGVAQVNVHGLIAAAFTHRDSRAGDPDLHTHVAISNKVQTHDGRWLALDGRPIHRNAVAASERYNTRLEALLVDRLGVRFADRLDHDRGKRPVREIVGVYGPLPRLWSSRRTAIDARRAVLATRFQTDHGRPPTTVEAIALAQQANLETRQAKHAPQSRAEQRSTWRAEALAVLGGERQLHNYLARVLNRANARAPSHQPSSAWVLATAEDVISTVSSTRATWQENHVRAEAERRARAVGIQLAHLDRTVDQLVSASLSPPLSTRLDEASTSTAPAALRRTDGSSVHTSAGSATYTSTAVLAAEQSVLAAAGRHDGRVTPTSSVDVALLESVANGVTLNAGQERLVRELATSGARVQLALAPAGTGKTTAMSVLAAAWRAGGGEIVGLAPSAAASSVLRDQLGTTTDTLAKLVHALSTGHDVPSWMDTMGPETLVVIDEAGMAGTADLAGVVEFVTGVGGSVRLIGDDRQLAAIGAGGLLRDLATRYGAVTLTQVVRFTDPDTGEGNHAEGAASLALRDGDPAALAYYVDHGRIHVGDVSTATEDAYSVWAADRAAGRDAILLAPTRDLAADLNARARHDRLAREKARGPEVALVDGSRASAGDVVLTRRNRRRLQTSATDWVKNGDRWTVAAVDPSGAIDVVDEGTGRQVTLPADYVHAHVTLGYATTVHAAQGVTADSAYVIATGAESRQQLYVALTRGRHENHVFLAIAGDGDPHTAITRDALLPPTAVDVLTRVLDRDDASISAGSWARTLADPTARLGKSSDCYHHALSTAAEQQLGQAALEAIDLASEAAVSGLTLYDAYPALRGHLALCALAGHDPAALLHGALMSPRGLDDARDVAAVLDWRIDLASLSSTVVGPVPWLPAVPQSLAPNSEWGPYLDERQREVAALADEVSEQARSWTPTTAPTWARPFLDGDVALVADLAVWRATHGVDDGDLRPTGPAQRAAVDARVQRTLDARAAQLVGAAGSATARWRPFADGLDPRVASDPYWPVLADRLSFAERAGVDVASILRAAGGRPLPDEQPAAALWWRVSAHVSPAAATAPTLLDVLGAPAADRVAADSTGSTLVPDDGRVVGPCRGRLLELNEHAAAFFTSRYGDAWAPAYLAGRLGTDETVHVDALERFTIGYAPRGWTALSDHLRHLGATDDEIVAAGLGSWASTGRVIDRFRDRLVFAIRGADGIHGWIGRRNPAHDDDRKPAVSKYLNTAQTHLFTKGDGLYGLTESTPALAAGAVPVLVEGPLDALAATIAGDGAYVGIAPLGTSFTDHQADLLGRHIKPGQHGVIVATDPDRAGQVAAEQIFWKLIARGDDPRHLLSAPGEDPAERLRTAGPEALRSALDTSGRLASSLIHARIESFTDRMDTVEGQVLATRRAAAVIAALPTTSWPTHLVDVVARTGIAPDIAAAEVIDAASRDDRVLRDDARTRIHPTTSPAGLLERSRATKMLAVSDREARAAAGTDNSLPARASMHRR